MFAGLHFHGLPCAGVEGLTSFCLRDTKGAEASEGETTGAFQLFDDSPDQIGGGAICGYTGHAGGLLQDGCKERFGQDGILFQVA